MSADSRLSLSSGSINATLWKHDLDSLSMDLHLPPGWRLLHASGVDQVRGHGSHRGNLLDFFHSHHGLGGGAPMGQEMGRDRIASA